MYSNFTTRVLRLEYQQPNFAVNSMQSHARSYPVTPALLAKCLEHAVTECSDRGLRVAAKWAAEKLNHVALPDHHYDGASDPHTSGGGGGRSSKLSGSRGQTAGAHDHSMTTDDDLTNVSFISNPPMFGAPSPSPSHSARNPPYLQPHKWRTPADRLLYLEAKAYFDCHEYLRCAHRLRDSEDLKCMYLWGYALYLAGERVASEERGDPVTSMTQAAVTNGRVSQIVERVAARQRAEVVSKDSWLQYLLGLLYVRLDQADNATSAFVRSVNLYTYNWSAWSELVKLVSSLDKYLQLEPLLPSGPMRHFFTMTVHFSGVYRESADDAMYHLARSFRRDSPVFQDLAAHVFFIDRERERAISIWTALLDTDPYRLDSFPTYALALFYGKHDELLGRITRHVLSIDKCRPEPWIVLANMHALSKEHHSAVNALQRALRLDPENGEAWNTLGDQLREMKQFDAAVAAFTMALRINSHDHLALFGLGSLYSSIDMHVMALEYFDRATAVSPHDARLWPWLARCLYRLSQTDSAVLAAKRAIHLCLKLKLPVDPDMYLLVGKALAASKPKPISTLRGAFKVARSPRASWAVTGSPRAGSGSGAASGASASSPAYVSGRTQMDDVAQRQRMAARGLGGGAQHQLMQHQRERSGSPGNRLARAGSAGGGGGGGAGGTSTEDDEATGDAGSGPDDPLTWYLAAWKDRPTEDGNGVELTAAWAMDMVEYLVEWTLGHKGHKEPVLAEYIRFAEEMANKDGALQSRVAQLRQRVSSRGGAGGIFG
ncbi:hypothetical protein BCR44DRAFT_1170238 [Catenaria anguillulae PL171]|uniref:Cdc23 domain-containing protein n=1 Tax=Catenaria anguillulae PL171 TaxID=765915 RepID=A0A1Y2I1U9_9FUNG|nr:hypothetical protein BCR44DRAFT_1170238 [Catenaria anguillulae PL171]